MLQEEENDEVQTLACRIDNVKILSDILSCLCVDMSKAQECQVEATPEVTARSKATQARVGFQSDLFDEFNCSGESLKFAINLTILVDCLQLFGTSSETTSAVMTFSTLDAIFKLSLEESGVVTTCDILSLHHDDSDELLQQGLFAAFRESPEECQIIVKSEPLKECVHDMIDAIWVGSIEVEVGNNPLLMKMSTGGKIGRSDVTIPRTSSAFVSFRCGNPVRFSYPLKSFILGMKALNVAKETYIRINGDGMMCVQHQIETAKGQETYFDFLMVAEDSTFSDFFSSNART